MGQVLHGSARTTEAVRRAIQLRQESVRATVKRYGISPTTVQKWHDRETPVDAAMGPKEPRSTVLTPEEEAIVVAFRQHSLLPLDDCLYGLQPTIPHLTRSSLHRCLERHGTSRLPEVEGDKPEKKRFAQYPIGYFHIDIAQVSSAQGKLSLLVAIDRTSKFAFVRLVESAGKMDLARRRLRQRRIEPEILTRKDQPRQLAFDKAAYRERSKVERRIGRLKQYRRIATRYEKWEANYLAMVTLGMSMLWLK